MPLVIIKITQLNNNDDNNTEIYTVYKNKKKS